MYILSRLQRQNRLSISATMPLIPSGKRKFVKPIGKDRLGTERNISTSRFDFRQEVKTLETVEKDDEYRQRAQIYF